MDGTEMLPWPKRGESLFAKGDDSWNEACLDWTHGDPEVFCAGYLKAAEAVADRVLGEGNDREFLVYPIAFCYRHYLELRMKGLVEQAWALTDARPTDAERREMGRHSVLRLWRVFRPMLERIEPRGGKAELEAVEEMLTELDQLDPLSQTFRYAKDKDGRVPLQEGGVKRVDIRILRETMMDMSAFLDAVAGVLSEYLGYKMDIAAEHGAEIDEGVRDWLC